MAGGIGSRFWPVSTSTNPKQFHDILGTGETLIQQTYRRLKKLTEVDKILVVTHKNYKDLVAEQLPELPLENIILEPARRNTAPCVAYSAFRIKKKDPNAVMLISPADHLVTDEDEFVRIARLAAEQAEERKGLFTLGIKPHRPDTGYGYIQFTSPKENSNKEVKVVKTFTEKPNVDLAKEFISSGDFLWNSGIFIWTTETVLGELKQYLPDMYNSFEAGANMIGTDQETRFIERMYPSCENESIDYGLMEKSQKVYVIPSDFGWSDLGTWGSLYEHSEINKDGNALIAQKILSYNSKDNLIRLPEGKLGVIEGLEGFIVVDHEDSLLICKKEHEQLIKSFVNDVKLSFGDHHL